MAVHPLPLVEMYLIFQLLPLTCRPAWLYREDGATLVAVDPRSTKAETTAWAVEHLTPAELNTMRAAFGAPPVGQPCPDHWLDDTPVDTNVPEMLRPWMWAADESA